MIRLRNDCKDCVHAEMCKWKDNARIAMEKLKKMQYGKGPNDDYDWNTIIESKHVNIEFSCPDFRCDPVRHDQARNKVQTYEKKKEKEKEATKPVRGDEVVCNSGLSNFIGIYWGEGEYYYYILLPDIEKPREMSKDYWKLTKTGRHVDLFGVKND